MNNLEKRLENLERQTGAGKPESKTFVIVNGEPDPPGIAETDTIIRVVDEETRELTLRIIAGEVPGGKPQ